MKYFTVDELFFLCWVLDNKESTVDQLKDVSKGASLLTAGVMQHVVYPTDNDGVNGHLAIDDAIEGCERPLESFQLIEAVQKPDDEFQQNTSNSPDRRDTGCRDAIVPSGCSYLKVPYLVVVACCL